MVTLIDKQDVIDALDAYYDDFPLREEKDYHVLAGVKLAIELVNRL